MSSVGAYIAERSKGLVFLRQNFVLLMTWPIAALLVMVVGWGALLSNLHTQREQAEQAALTRAAALARGYARQLSWTVESIDQILFHVKFEWALSGSQLSLENAKASGLFPPASMFNVSIIDRNGAVSTSVIPASGGTALEDKDWFQFHRNSTTDVLFIGSPAFGRITKRISIPFSRKILDMNGGFDGVAVVGVVPDFLTASYDRTTVGEYGIWGVAAKDVVLGIASGGHTGYPSGLPVMAALPAFPAASGSSLMTGGRWFSDHRARYVGWDAVERYGLTTLVGLDRAEALAPYQSHRAVSIRTAMWGTLALATFTLVAMGLSMRLAWRKYRMEQTQLTYRMATEEGSDGFFIARQVLDANGAIADFEIIDSNHRGAGMLRQRRDELLGKRLSSLYEGASPERLMRWMCHAVQHGFFEDDVEVPSASPLAPLWVHVKIVRYEDEIAITLRDISDTKAHLAELERRTNEDSLTGLPNRRWAQSYLPQAIRHAAEAHGMLALLFIDLDGFKAVNDTLGHAAGDELLKNAAMRIKDAVRPHDFVVRLGGDEFLVIVEQIVDRTDAAAIARRTVQAFKESFRLSKGVHSVGASIGISTFPIDGADADTLLHNADIAMYAVKTAGKGNYGFYDERFYEGLRHRLRNESELRSAIEEDQFVMYYQPRIDLLSGATSSMESLVRWHHPTRGLLQPLEFIPLAEETGLILDLGKVVIDKVCAQLARWAAHGDSLVPVSINLSSQQFNETNTAAVLAAALRRHRIDPALVEVEVTESSMMGNSVEVSEALTAIRRLGIKLSVDDFGTGYSSLSQLQRLDFDVLKVDRAFTAEIDKTERGVVFFKAIITMAHAIGMRVVAEGVENEQQIEILRQLHCDELQGFFISRPLPPSDVQPVLARWSFASEGR